MNESVRLKVLMVHGYRQNGNSFREKTGAFRKVLKKYIEPVFITAPMVLPENEAESAWWFSDEDRFSSREVSATCRGFDRSVEAVREAVRTHGHIDGVMGFSQGAALVALLCALQQRGDENFGFNFAILIAGFRSRSSPHQYLYAEPIILPSLHVIGAGDQVISAGLVDMSEDTTNECDAVGADAGPEEGSTKELLSLSGSPRQDRLLLQPFHYICQTPGKQIRTRLAEAFNHWLKVPTDKLHQIGDIVEMLHNASLLVDDIEDCSILRRGIPVAHSIYGTATTINAANYVYFMGLERAQALGHDQATRVFCEQLLELHRGQGMEIYWREQLKCPTEHDYRLMTIRKTGGLFGLATRLMQLFSDNKDDFTKLSSTLGLFFQIRDDYANLCLPQYAENKSYAEDLTEGKFNFPCIHAIRSRPEDSRVLNIIRQRTQDIEVKKYCITLLRQFGSFDYTVETLQCLDTEARKEISNLGGNPYLEKVITSLKVW